MSGMVGQHHRNLHEELESYIKSIEKPPFDWSTHPKNKSINKVEM